MIPLAYLPGGALNVDQLKQARYFVQVNHEDRALPRVANPTYVYIDQTLGWGLAPLIRMVWVWSCGPIVSGFIR